MTTEKVKYCKCCHGGNEGWWPLPNGKYPYCNANCKGGQHIDCPITVENKRLRAEVRK